MSDNINHPAHYCQGGIECIDVIRAALGDDGCKAFCLGNALKYLYRARYKGRQEEDIAKANWYLSKWLELDRTETQDTSVAKQSESPLDRSEEELLRAMDMVKGMREFTASAQIGSPTEITETRPPELKRCPKCHKYPSLAPSMFNGGRYYYLCECSNTLEKLKAREADNAEDAAAKWNMHVLTEACDYEDN